MKRVLFYVLSLCSMVSVVSGCTKDSGPVDQEDTQLTVSVDNVEMSEEGDTQTFRITSNTSWYISGAKAWLDVEPMTGEGNKVVTLKTSENEALKERSCTLVIETDDGTISHEVVVSQSGAMSVLEVDVKDVILGAVENSQSSFKVKSNGSWTISGKPDWMELSSNSGTGDVTVTVTANSTNYSSADREATLVIASESDSQQVKVSQKAAWLSNCVAKPINLTVLYNCVGFSWEFTDEVSYYYRAEIEKSEADRMTTLEIVDYVTSTGTRDTPGDNYISSTGYLYPETDYVLYSVAYNEDGAQGVLYSCEFTTKSYENQPYASILNIEYDWYYWYWDTKIGSYARAYYMWVTENETLMDLTDGLVAYIVKRDIEDYPNSYPKILQSDSWMYAMSNLSFMIITWAVDDDNEFSGYIEREEAYVMGDSSKSNTRETSVKKNNLTYDEYKNMMSSLKRMY